MEDCFWYQPMQSSDRRVCMRMFRLWVKLVCGIMSKVTIDELQTKPDRKSQEEKPAPLNSCQSLS
jgi:hypothetical protein